MFYLVGLFDREKISLHSGNNKDLSIFSRALEDHIMGSCSFDLKFYFPKDVSLDIPVVWI